MRSAEQVAAQLEADGYEPLIVEVTELAPDEPQTGALGNLVRTGSFTTQAAADELRAELTAKGYTSCAPSTPARPALRTAGRGSCTCSRSTRISTTGRSPPS